MYTRYSKINDGGLSGHFLATFLRTLDCRQVNVEQQDSDNSDQLVCGFSSNHPDVLLVLSAVFPEYEVYQIDSSYIVRLSKEAVERQWQRYFEKTLQAILVKGPWSTIRGRYSDSNHRVNKYAFVLADRAAIPEKFALIEKLFKVGLGLRNERYFTGSYYDNAYRPFPMTGIHYAPQRLFPTIMIHEENLIAVDDYEKFIRRVLLSPIRNDALKKIKGTAVKSIFRGAPRKYDESRGILEFFERRSESKDAPRLGPATGALAAENNREERFITAIKERIHSLENEIDSCLYWFNKDLKGQKIKFLNVVLHYKRVNPLFPLKECLKLAMRDDPALYHQAIKGRISTLTRDLLDGILSSQEFTPSSFVI
jgi:hypothetical protein